MSLPDPTDLDLAIDCYREQVVSNHVPGRQSLAWCGGDCNITDATAHSGIFCAKCELDAAELAVTRGDEGREPGALYNAQQRMKDAIFREQKEQARQDRIAARKAKKAAAAAAATAAAAAAAAATDEEPQYEAEVVGHLPQKMLDGTLVPARFRVHFVGHSRKEDLWYDIGDPGLANCQEECERFMAVKGWKKCLKLRSAVRKKITASKVRLAMENDKLARLVAVMAGLEQELDWHNDEVDRVTAWQPATDEE